MYVPDDTDCRNTVEFCGSVDKLLNCFYEQLGLEINNVLNLGQRFFFWIILLRDYECWAGGIGICVCPVLI